jgi:uncharacterized protein
VFRASRYNFTVTEIDGRVALFNTRTGSLISLTGESSGRLGEYLTSPIAEFAGDEFEAELLSQLSHGGHLVQANFQELADIQERYWKARGETPIVLTVTTTMDCNLGCYYCYEDRSSRQLEIRDIDDLATLARERLQSSGKRSLHVDWYGGEPLLNVTFIEEASKHLQALCEECGVRYVSSIISNGTEWPDDVEGFVDRHQIRQVQISFDGLRDHHDKRRRYRRGRDVGASSFERAVALVDKLVRCVRTDLRFNIDRGNKDDLLPFVRFACDRNWFAAPFPAVFQPARLASYSKTSGFMRDHELTLGEFDDLRALVRNELGQAARIEESEVPDGFPWPKTSVCAALADDSVVVGAEGLTYRCGLQVGEANRAVGSIKASHSGQGNNSDESWWRGFDPTTLPTCSKCSFLPICWGGCPKKHLENDLHAIREQGKYWRTNLPRLIAGACNFEHLREAEIPENVQFR